MKHECEKKKTKKKLKPKKPMKPHELFGAAGSKFGGGEILATESVASMLKTRWREWAD